MLMMMFSFLKAMGCGALAGGSAQLFASPADLIKIQLQMEGRRRAEGLPPKSGEDISSMAQAQTI